MANTREPPVPRVLLFKAMIPSSLPRARVRSLSNSPTVLPLSLCMAAENRKAPGFVTGGTSKGFSRFATGISNFAGSSWMFIVACAAIVLWGVTGPLFHYSDSWQLVINTATTIVTFLMVFLIQNTQNRDTRAMNLKLDEIIRSIRHAHNEMIDIEKLSDEELQELAKKYQKIREEADHRAASRGAKKTKKKLPAA